MRMSINITDAPVRETNVAFCSYGKFHPDNKFIWEIDNRDLANFGNRDYIN